MKRKKYKASFSVEAAYVFSVVFFSISAAIRFAWAQRNFCLAAFVLSEGCEQASHAEAVYEPDSAEISRITSDLRQRLSSAGALRGAAPSLSKDLFTAEAALTDAGIRLRIRQRIYSPESTMRAATTLTEFKDKAKTYKGGENLAANSE